MGLAFHAIEKLGSTTSAVARTAPPFRRADLVQRREQELGSSWSERHPGQLPVAQPLPNTDPEAAASRPDGGRALQRVDAQENAAVPGRRGHHA